MSETRNPWKVLSTRPVYDNPWISVVEHQVLTPAGTPGIYGIVSPKKLALGVVPFTQEGKVVLVGQYRFALGAYSWEIPEGGGDKALTPQESAARELKEETGYSAQNWQEILRLHLSNSVSDELAVCFLAWNLTPGEAVPDETEVLALKEVSFGEAMGLVMDGTITDAITVASLLKIRALGAGGDLPQAILRHIR